SYQQVAINRYKQRVCTMKCVNKLTINVVFFVTLLSLTAFANVAFAQTEGHSVSFDSVTGSPGDTVTLTFSFENTSGADSALEARARISNVDVFSNIDHSGFCDEAVGDYVDCTLNDENRLFLTVTNF